VLKTLDRGDTIDLIIEHPTNGTFLLQREKVDGEIDQVHFVGGGTEGEAHEQAIAKELEEETGFKNFEIIASKVGAHTHIGYRHTKGKNQKGLSYFYHLKLKSLEQVPSEIEEGLHTIEWVDKDKVSENLTWESHISTWQSYMFGEVESEPGSLINSGEFDGISSEEAKVAITKKVGGKLTNTYRLRDWSIGRQRYWGVPIPIVYDPQGKAHPVPKEHLPWTLPEDVDFTPTGVAPLAKSKELKDRTEKIFGAGWTPEVETMDTFVDSSWYYLRYLDNKNDDELVSKKAEKDWMSVDIYFGGPEHTTMHLLYSRFWQKALKKLSLVNDSEPYKKRINRGLILGPDGNKMSKSKGNVVDPDEQVKLVGSDTVKMYLAFMGPYGEAANYPWDMGGIAGQRRFLERVYGLTEHVKDEESKEVTSLLHKTIQKVTGDIKALKFNTAISAMMIFVNHAEKAGLTATSHATFIRMLSPFAPHLTEQIWSDLGNKESIHLSAFPNFDPELTKDDEVTIGVQINGKMKGQIILAPDATETVALELVKNDESLAKKLAGLEIKKVIYVPGRILSLII
jgi:leucyl-tRNA synthetase